MSEFIREVDDEYRQDQIRGMLGRYWVAIAALALLVLISVGAWRGYVYYRQQQAEAASNRYFDATQMFPADKAGSLASLDALAKDGPAGYRMLARFKAASEIGQADAAAGARAFDVLAADPDLNADLKDIARLRAAMLMIDTDDPAEIRHRFEPLADANAPFRNLAREMLAILAFKRGDDADAKHWLDAVASDSIASQDQRQRAGFLLGLIRSGKPGEVAEQSPAAPSPEPAVPAAQTPSVPAMTPPPVADQPPVAKP